ncbi:hypothetical protein TIFTF001_033664 [Ficus carica]|uniref:Uncharacterized protein n=1 Tax=Ficus carica TaxID=3494 RepID=A0AA88E2F8_FICCA|nr:hypothetical protein TIFTF001_033664 [Ficus carica]
MYKAFMVITKSAATETTRAIVERYLDLALHETEVEMEKIMWQHASSSDNEMHGDNDEICCGESHCPLVKRKKIGSASSSDKEVHGSSCRLKCCTKAKTSEKKEKLLHSPLSFCLFFYLDNVGLLSTF